MSADGTPEGAKNFYLANRPSQPRATIEMWRPTILQMIQDGMSCKVAHSWMETHAEQHKLPIPALTTVRDWMTQLRSKDPKAGHQSPRRLKEESILRDQLPKKSPGGEREPRAADLQGDGLKHPDLFLFAVKEFPEHSKTEAEFREAVLPVFLERQPGMQDMYDYYRKMTAAGRNELACQAFEKLPAMGRAQFISHYADIHTILRANSVTSESWIEGIFRGRREFQKNSELAGS